MKREHAWQKYIPGALIAAVVTSLAIIGVNALQVPNPSMILCVIMIFFTAAVSSLAGAVSGICILIYGADHFSDDHSIVHFSGVNCYIYIVVVISIVLMYLMVSWIRNKRDQVMDSLKDANEQLQKQNEKLEEESYHDPLTGLYNRRGGEERIAEVLKRDAGNGIRAAASVMDIDDFKDINDAYGHGAGDAALCAFSQALQKNFPDRSILIRTGGDEFVLVQADDLPAFEEKLNRFASEKFSFTYENHTISFTISCGYSYFPEKIISPVETLRQADAALYQAKIQGKHAAFKYEGGTSPEETVYGFPLRGVAENLPVAFLVYKADESEEILLASNSLLKMCECRDFTSFRQMTGGTFRGFVYPDDLEETEKSIHKQIFENHSESDSVHYRIRTNTGKIVEVHDLGRLVHDQNLGDLFYVTVYDNNIIKAEQRNG